ncbi:MULTISPECIES: thioredoxin-disulfide reductase [unclassified Prochlorococcus]|uniref:thioredoxin-disulfide reductase n=1 Tax=unclassified Prochlorococcus TaxID=2627481 RepID=UPI0005338877|nr:MULTISPECIES: thioredoxin-disulfide reductase [unclassified Prochlorococcus]KGG15563.1 Thioredoxin reductase [Prochlorococcus sp. MIT 0602]KGG17843.1 Thioredoxin reductase [Prochlorococcus sp. MIT 0603]
MSIENLVIIGSGPAGYTAAIYAARANLQPLLVTGFTRGGIPGGQLMNTTFVENYPGFPDGIMGPDLMDLIKAQALRWGTNLLEMDADYINIQQNPFIIKTSTEEIRTHSLIIATGASANKLGVPNESNFWNKGISACAICDGATPQFRNERLAVVGGGDSACEEAVYLTKYGSQVHLLVRSNQLKASKAMADRVKANSQITIHWETELIDVQGDKWIKTLSVRNLKTKAEKTLQAKGLFYAIGHTPNTDLIKNQLSINSNGYINTQPGRPETSVDGVFAAGDVADPEWRQGVTAAGSGCKAALAAERWLTEKNLASLITRKNVDPENAEKQLEIKTATKENFNPHAFWQKGSYALRKLYHESSQPILVIYTSTNCGPCHILKPQLKRVIKELEGKVQAIEIDIDSEHEIAKQAGVTGTPTTQLFLKKELKAQWQGVKQRSVFKEEIEKFLT